MKPIAIPRMERRELVQFVLNFCDGQIFSLAHLPRESDLVGMVFMPIALGCFTETPEEDVKQIGMIWEYLSAACPRSVNGYPMFMSLKVMHRDDWTEAAKMIEGERGRREAMLNGADR